jgi:cob(I)alamin adenosyltransferase
MDFRHVTTRGGDRGESTLYDGSRRRKDHLTFEALGDLDELSSAVGMVRRDIRHYPEGSEEGAERILVQLIRSRETSRTDLREAQHCLNRLSDYLFVVARYVEQSSA